MSRGFAAWVLVLVAAAAPAGAAVNLAAGRPTMQSSTYPGGAHGSERGVDGAKYDSSLFHTNADAYPWWEVDLGQAYAIDNVTLYNRVNCCEERVQGIQVWLSLDGVAYDLVFENGGQVFRNRRADVGGLSARYVRVALPRREYLHLQEVEVYQYGTWQPPAARVPVIRRAHVNAVGGPAGWGGQTESMGDWRGVGTGDCPGRDVGSSTGPNPVAGRCTPQFAGFTAVCWGNSCTYKNIPTAQCTGGANPGRMYTCGPR